MNSPSPVVHVVDDEDVVRTALSNLLSAAGYEVRTYSSSTEFLLSVPRTPADVSSLTCSCLVQVALSCMRHWRRKVT